MSKNIERIEKTAIVPVVVIEDVANAVPTANAMLAGGIDIMEITFRTAAAEDAIRAVAQECPDMLVGAGTVLTLEQCKRAVNAGAKFIVSPGFDEEVVRWCVENDIDVLPGCVTPTEIMKAMSLGLSNVKFFPANVYGGLGAMKALHGPFGSVRFVPTGGVNEQNMAEYLKEPYILAVGGSWCCAKGDVSAGNYDKITKLCAQARKNALGFQVAHIGINCDDAAVSEAVCGDFQQAFGFETKFGSSSNFSSTSIEVMKSNYLGEKGHIAVYTNRIAAAVAELEKRGYEVDHETEKYKDGKLIAVYLKSSFGGFAVHLLQK